MYQPHAYRDKLVSSGIPLGLLDTLQIKLSPWQTKILLRESEAIESVVFRDVGYAVGSTVEFVIENTGMKVIPFMDWYLDWGSNAPISKSEWTRNRLQTHLYLNLETWNIIYKGSRGTWNVVIDNLKIAIENMGYRFSDDDMKVLVEDVVFGMMSWRKAIANMVENKERSGGSITSRLISADEETITGDLIKRLNDLNYFYSSGIEFAFIRGSKDFRHYFEQDMEAQDLIGSWENANIASIELRLRGIYYLLRAMQKEYPMLYLPSAPTLVAPFLNQLGFGSTEYFNPLYILIRKYAYSPQLQQRLIPKRTKWVKMREDFYDISRMGESLEKSLDRMKGDN